MPKYQQTQCNHYYEEKKKQIVYENNDNEYERSKKNVGHIRKRFIRQNVDIA